MLDGLQYRILKRISPTGPVGIECSAYHGKSKLKALLGDDTFQMTRDKVVIDFGCGAGNEAIELAQNGATLVMGVDIQEKMLSQTRERAAMAGAEDKCIFSTRPSGLADVIISLDSFEHFSDAAGVPSRNV